MYISCDVESLNCGMLGSYFKLHQFVLKLDFKIVECNKTFRQLVMLENIRHRISSRILYICAEIDYNSDLPNIYKMNSIYWTRTTEIFKLHQFVLKLDFTIMECNKTFRQVVMVENIRLRNIESYPGCYIYMCRNWPQLRPTTYV